MKAAIIGTRYAGKTTLFQLLTHASSHAGQVMFSGVGEWILRDPAVEDLQRLMGSARTGFPALEVYDFEGFGKMWNEEKAGLVFSHLQGFDLLIHLINGVTQDPVEDFETVDLRMILTDLDSAERIRKRITKEIQAGKRDAKLGDLLDRCIETLESNRPLSSLSFRPSERKQLKGFGFVTLLPRLWVLNVEEGGRYASFVQMLKERGLLGLEFNVALETELLDMDPSEQEEIRQAYGFGKDPWQKVLPLVKQTLQLMTFYTANEREARAWLVHEGATAIDAAATIHKDLAEGFIKAEIVAFEDLLAAGSWKEARDKGKVRIVGKDHPIADRDVILIRFRG